MRAPSCSTSRSPVSFARNPPQRLLELSGQPNFAAAAENDRRQAVRLHRLAGDDGELFRERVGVEHPVLPVEQQHAFAGTVEHACKALLCAQPLAVAILQDEKRFERRVSAFPVADSAGRPYDHPFLGGFNVPRPQLVDVDAGDGEALLAEEAREEAAERARELTGPGPRIEVLRNGVDLDLFRETDREAMRGKLQAWRTSVGARMLTPNPDFDASLFKRRYEDFDPSRPPGAGTGRGAAAAPHARDRRRQRRPAGGELVCREAD